MIPNLAFDFGGVVRLRQGLVDGICLFGGGAVPRQSCGCSVPWHMPAMLRHVRCLCVEVVASVVSSRVSLIFRRAYRVALSWQNLKGDMLESTVVG